MMSNMDKQWVRETQSLIYQLEQRVAALEKQMDELRSDFVAYTERERIIEKIRKRGAGQLLEEENDG